jgi:hypothetical protein
MGKRSNSNNMVYSGNMIRKCSNFINIKPYQIAVAINGIK